MEDQDHQETGEIIVDLSSLKYPENVYYFSLSLSLSLFFFLFLDRLREMIT